MKLVSFFFVLFSPANSPRLPSKKFESDLQVFPREAPNWMPRKALAFRGRPFHMLIEPESNPALLDLAVYDATFPYLDEPDYSAVDFTSRLDYHAMKRHERLNTFVHEFLVLL